MLNPSTADAERDDPTIRRCAGFARRWGCGQLVVLNLFAFCTSDPRILKQAADPVGSANKTWFQRALQNHDPEQRGPVVCAWGVHGMHLGQDATVLRWLAALGVKPCILGMTRGGAPRHPLYLPYSARLLDHSPLRSPIQGESAEPQAATVRTAPRLRRFQQHRLGFRQSGGNTDH
jgi:hypothetical protein